MSFHYPTVNYQIPLHFGLKRGEPPLKLSDLPGCLTKFLITIGKLVLERFEFFLMLLCLIVHHL